MPSTVIVATMSILADALLGVKTHLNRLALKPESSEQVFSDVDCRTGSAETRGENKEKKMRKGESNMLGLMVTVLLRVARIETIGREAQLGTPNSVMELVSVAENLGPDN